MFRISIQFLQSNQILTVPSFYGGWPFRGGEDLDYAMDYYAMYNQS